MPASPEPPTWVDGVLRAGSVVLTLGIVILSLGPAPEEPTIEISDKVIHGLSYFSLTLAVLLAWVGRPARPAPAAPDRFLGDARHRERGGLVELAQTLVSRQTEALDALANTAGAGLALGLWTVLMRVTPKRT
jgi:VanZ family protein